MREASVSYRRKGNHREPVAGGHSFSEEIGWNERELAAKVSEEHFVRGEGPSLTARLTPSVENRKDANPFIERPVSKRRRVRSASLSEIGAARNGIAVVAEPPVRFWGPGQRSCFREIPTSRKTVPTGVSTRGITPNQLIPFEAGGNPDEGARHAPSRSTGKTRVDVPHQLR
jgi:hypothetical protein